MNLVRISMLELSACLNPNLKDPDASHCYELIEHYVESSLRQLGRIWDPNSLKLFDSFDKLETKRDFSDRLYDRYLHIRDIQFMFISIVNFKRLLLIDKEKKKEGRLEKLILRSNLSKKDELLNELDKIRNRLKVLNYEEARHYLEHYDERIGLNKKNEEVPILEGSLQFATFNPQMGILEIQNINEPIEKIDISQKTVIEFCSLVQNFLKNLYTICEDSLSTERKKFLEEIRKDLSQKLPKRSQ